MIEKILCCFYRRSPTENQREDHPGIIRRISNCAISAITSTAKTAKNIAVGASIGALDYNAFKNLYYSSKIKNCNSFLYRFIQYLENSEMDYFTLSQEETEYQYGFYKFLQTSKGSIAAPVMEEFLFKVILQNLILTKSIKFILNKISKDLGNITESKKYLFFKILLTAICFGLAHNNPTQSSSNTKLEIAIITLGGAINGLVYEKFGLIGAIASHASHNYLITRNFLDCEPRLYLGEEIDKYFYH